MWRLRAEALFFEEHNSVTRIAEMLNLARETVSRHICACEGYKNEVEYRKRVSAEKRREYKRRWDNISRKRPVADLPEDKYLRVTGETIRNEQALAAFILSCEKR